MVFGDERRVGLWIAPFLLLTALTAAVLTAGVTVLVYSQRVDSLREEVSGASAAAAEATADIEALVAAFRDELDLTSEGATEDGADPPPTNPTDRVFAIGVSAGDGSTRVGSAFPFFSDDATTFLITSAEVVGAASAVNIYLPQGVVGAVVNGVDPERDLATLRIDLGGIAPLPWRPADQPVAIGTSARVQGVGGPDTVAVVPALLVGVGQQAVLVDVALTDYLRGAPLLDAQGRVIAVLTQGYQPYGQVGGQLVYLPPVRAVCLVLVQCAPDDLGGLPPLPPAATPQPAPTAGVPRPPPAVATTAPPPPTPTAATTAPPAVPDPEPPEETTPDPSPS
ncbi:MAG TPA: S1C family serine protease [Euzebya sp.]|nr:S1C family serine protease [Euzebya sp.]